MLFLKCFSILHKRNGYFLYLFAVAPHAGAWIEIFSDFLRGGLSPVAPHAGAWIEILVSRHTGRAKPVAPHAGAWIEIPGQAGHPTGPGCRSPRGSVD